MTVFRSSYMSYVYEDPKDFGKLVKRVARGIKRVRQENPFDALAFRGTSGAALAYPISALMGIPLISVRKSAETSHTFTKVEGSINVDVQRYAIIDDFISSGDTVEEMIKEINNFSNNFSGGTSPALVGIFVYNEREYRYKDYTSYAGAPIYKL